MKLKIISKIVIFGMISVIGVTGIAYYIYKAEHRPKDLRVYIFNLKNGHSMFIRTPDDQRVLISGGNNSEVISHLTKILPFYSRRIDEVIAIDTDGRNVSGLIDVLERYSVGEVIVPTFTLKSLGLASSIDKIYETFIDTAKRKNISIRAVSGDDELIFDRTNDGPNSRKVRAEILFPTPHQLFEYSKASDPEIVFRIAYGANSIFYLGNVTPKIQKFIASKQENLRSDLLIVRHSASPDSFSAELVKKIKPKYLVYSKTISKSSARTAGGKNKKTDPLFFVLNDKRFNVKEGTVKIVMDGSKIDISH